MAWISFKKHNLFAWKDYLFEGVRELMALCIILYNFIND